MPSRPLSALASITTNPLVLLGVGAALSGLIVPALTSGAQNHREALAIKGDLVSSMTTAASPFLAATRANHLVYRGRIPRSYDLAFQLWDSRGNEILTKLQTRYPGADVTDRWFHFTLRMRDLYYIFRVSPQSEAARGYRTYYVQNLQRFLGDLCRTERNEGCAIVDFKALDRWLAAPTSRFQPRVAFYLDELLVGFRVALSSIEDEALTATPRL